MNVTREPGCRARQRLRRLQNANRNHKTTRTPAWRAAGGTVCALPGTVEYLLQGFVNVVDICNESLTHKLKREQPGAAALAL